MENKYKFIDLFCGIGGFRLGLERNGLECVFSSEINEHACEMYEANFKDNPRFDITKLDVNQIPDFDVLCAGFPCQAFSVAGKKQGFEDTRGTLFFDICRILEHKKPAGFILENVDNLAKHDGGKTLEVIIKSLTELGYTVNYKIFNANQFGVPQNRKRIIIVGNRKGLLFDFSKVRTQDPVNLYSVLEEKIPHQYLSLSEYTLIKDTKKQESGLIFSGYLNKNIRKEGVRPGTLSLSRTHKQPNRIYDANGVNPTLSSQESAGRYFILVDGKVRKLTVNECYRLMGFPDDFVKVGASGKLLERVGNSICVNMVQAIGYEFLHQILETKQSIPLNEESSPEGLLNRVLNIATQLKDTSSLNITDEIINQITVITDNHEKYKGVYGVVITSIVYKMLNPNQDIRQHKIKLENGYSGRTFDTKHIAPWLKDNGFSSNKESAWLTRSLEQQHPFDFNFPGAIGDKSLKNSFLQVINYVNNADFDTLTNILAFILYQGVEFKKNKVIKLVTPIKPESGYVIKDIINLIKEHFESKIISGRKGASILPVLSLYALYSCMTNELKRFSGKTLLNLASHTSSDRSSKLPGDINVFNDNEAFEVVEVKYDIEITPKMVEEIYEQKIKDSKVNRYYILSTKLPSQLPEINKIIDMVRTEHGCQIIVNGFFESIKYYLRLLDNIDTFIEAYVKLLEESPESLQHHKSAWEQVVKNTINKL